MAITAVAVDLGGVLEAIDERREFLDRWRPQPGLSSAEYSRSLLWPLGAADPGAGVKTGGLTESELRERYAAALGLNLAQASEFMADLWDWYCGELDAELAGFVAGLRPDYRTAILSNSADGARREEQERFGLEQLVDVLVYSHEIGVAKPDPHAYLVLCERLGVAPEELVFLDNRVPNVDAAQGLGIHALLHVSTPESIAAIRTLLSHA